MFLKNKQKNLKDYLCEAKKYWLFEKQHKALYKSI